MSTNKDYYEMLEVSKDASQAEIKKAYRKLAMKYHPDRTKGDKKSEEKFKEVSGAYKVLSDENSRAKYDRFGHSAFENGAGAGRSSQGFGGGMDDIINEFFGGGQGFGGFGGQSRTPRVRRGSDLRYTVELTLEEAAKGIEKEIKYKRKSACPICSGTGAKPGTRKKTCSKCNGTGEIKQVSNSLFGQFVNVVTCDACNGKGEVPEERCTKCHGTGIAKETITKKVKIPAGVDNGQKVRISDGGEVGDNGSNYGDLYLFIRVKQHEIFERSDNNIVCEVPISFATATLGGEIDIPTLDGKLKMKISAGTQTGKVFRLKEKGIKNVRGYGQGDQMVKINVEVPLDLTEEQKELLIKFDQEIQKNENSKSKNFWEKISEKFKK